MLLELELSSLLINTSLNEDGIFEMIVEILVEGLQVLSALHRSKAEVS